VNRDTNLKTGRLLCNRIYKLSYSRCKQTKHRENLAYRVRLSDYLNQKSRKEDETKFQPVHPTKEAPRKNQESRRGARAQRTHTHKKKRGRAKLTAQRKEGGETHSLDCAEDSLAGEAAGAPSAASFGSPRFVLAILSSPPDSSLLIVRRGGGVYVCVYGCSALLGFVCLASPPVGIGHTEWMDEWEGEERFASLFVKALRLY
jgi:hypothetical protein